MVLEVFWGGSGYRLSCEVSEEPVEVDTGTWKQPAELVLARRACHEALGSKTRHCSKVEVGSVLILTSRGSALSPDPQGAQPWPHLQTSPCTWLGLLAPAAASKNHDCCSRSSLSQGLGRAANEGIHSGACSALSLGGESTAQLSQPPH